MICYRIGKNCYINLTNRCSNACSFCVRTNGVFNGFNLWLDAEPTVDEVLEDVKKNLDCEEFVFCGFGEPLYRLEIVEKVGRFLKSQNKSVRLNTNGQASLIVGQGVAKRLVGAVDTVSISLNASNAKDYQKICNCEFGEEGFYSMLAFTDECVKAGLKTALSVVDVIGEEEIKKARELAAKHGAILRVREFV